MARAIFDRGRSLMNRITLALGVALAALRAVAPVAARPSVAAATTVNVTMKEFKFTLSKANVPHGTITFNLINKGKLAHDIWIAGKTSKLIKPGKTGKFVVTLKKGKYVYNCPVAGHTA